MAYQGKNFRPLRLASLHYIISLFIPRQNKRLFSEQFYFLGSGFFAKNDVSFDILEVSVFSSFCAPRETCVSALRFLEAPFDALPSLAVGAVGASSALIA